ncbi:MlaD family protein [Pararhodobacter zhoushanensis]|uniref:MlaD family protein n=1 Tax=Pararhodobacter zhoushanensis TaxID=2479545 RepID=UPI0029CAACB1|nr:MlaD family protein [Pararhodobacter zhoushanensis]
MAYRLWEIALGAVVMAAAVVFVVFALSATGTRLSESQGYALTATFRSAEGVRPGTDVRLAGVKIGTVSSLSLDPQSFRAQVSVTINNGIDLPRDSDDPDRL